MLKKTVFDSIVLAGGGSRCFWQIGFIETIKKEINFNPKQYATVSGSSAMTAMLLSETSKKGIDYFKKITAVNEKNFYPKNLFKKDAVFPQFEMYKDVLKNFINSDVLQNIKRGPKFNILITRKPKYLGARLGTFIGMMSYNIEKSISNPVHPIYASKLGFSPQTIKANDLSTPDELIELILASSCTPPLLPILKWKGKVALDGGLIDNVPVVSLDENPGKTLVLLTRKYPEANIPNTPDRTYVQPSEKIPIEKWEYSSPEGIEKTYQLGIDDAKKFLLNQK